MNFFNPRKRFRLRRIWLPLLFLALITAAFIRILQGNEDGVKTRVEPAHVAIESREMTSHHHLQNDHHEYPVIKKIIFICGEEITEVGTFKGNDIFAMLEEEPHLQLEWTEEGAAVLLDYIEDFLPNCKDNAYFGVDQDGNLSLFEGPPAQQKVLRTFFQIDIEFLKTSLPKEAVDQLYQGIKVVDFSAYNSVLSTFADFAVHRFAE